MSTAQRIYLGYAAGSLLCLVVALVSRYYFLAALPLGVLVAGQLILDYRPFFWLLLVSIPLGFELYLPGGLGTDLPTEPIAVMLTAVWVIHAARHWPEYDHRTYLHPVALLLYLHVLWIVVSACFAEVPLISIKFVLAKLWYVGAFFLLPLLVLRTPARVTTFARCVFWALLFVAVQTLLRHATYGFTFADQFRTMHPFMRNHVNYAGSLATLTPWIGYLLYRRKRRGKSWIWPAALIVPFWLTAIFFAYTRAAYVAVALCGVAYFVIRFGWLRPALAAAFAVAVAATVYLVGNNRYLDYAPNYETTVSHRELNNLIEATYNLEDISTMERFYRWVAGGNMVPYRPVVGFGPGNFVATYEGYTNNNFETYVSENEERSGIHNYFLMTTVEQGLPGLLFLLLFMGSILYYGQTLYRDQSDPLARAGIMAALLSIVVIGAFSLINDLLETDKIGSLFFLCTAIVLTLGHHRPADGSAGNGMKVQDPINGEGPTRHAG